MKKKPITNSDFQWNKMIRATEQRAAVQKPAGGKKTDGEWKASLHKLTI